MTVNIPKDMVARIPTGGLGEPAEVARLAVLLAQSSFITGQTLNPNGGMYPT